MSLLVIAWSAYRLHVDIPSDDVHIIRPTNHFHHFPARAHYMPHIYTIIHLIVHHPRLLPLSPSCT